MRGAQGRKWLLGTVVVMAIGLGAVAGCARTATETPDEPSSAKHYATVDLAAWHAPNRPTVARNSLVSGIVTSDGRPVAAALLSLLAWPNAAESAMAQEGDPVDTPVVATAVSDGAGRFVVSLDPAELPTTHIEQGDFANFALRVEDEVAVLMWNFTGHISGPEAVRTWSGLAADRQGEGLAPVHLAIDLGVCSSVVELDNEPTTWVDDGGEPLSEEAAAEKSRVHRMLKPGAEHPAEDC